VVPAGYAAILFFIDTSYVVGKRGDNPTNVYRTFGFGKNLHSKFNSNRIAGFEPTALSIPQQFITFAEQFFEAIHGKIKIFYRFPGPGYTS
jgi:hypothetical protein